MRNEIKFRGFYSEHRAHLAKIGAYHCFPMRRINSIYLDTSGFDFFTDSEEGTVPRMKIRYRWYGEGRFSDAGAIELKKTLATFREKEQIKIAGANFKKIQALCRDIAGFPVAPTVLVAYRREYFTDRSGSRFTLDYHIEYSAIDSELRARNKSHEKSCILEVKTDTAADADALTTRFGDMRTRHSKYCEAVKSCHSDNLL
ncbi:MAG: VTC domain-containing protein [Elusimicrobiota bacterium]